MINDRGFPSQQRLTGLQFLLITNEWCYVPSPKQANQSES
jgi:hypothetical protein